MIFAEQVEPHLPALRAYAMSLLRNPVDADDVVQDTLERALRFWPTLAGDTPPAGVLGWLRLMLYRLVCNRYQRTQRDRRLADEVVGDPSGDMRSDVAALDTRQQLDAAMQTISPLRRQIVERVLGQGESYQAVAESLGLPVGTVMSNLHRARAALKAAIDGAASADGPGIDLEGFETPEGVQPDANRVERVVRLRHQAALLS